MNLDSQLYWVDEAMTILHIKRYMNMCIFAQLQLI